MSVSFSSPIVVRHRPFRFFIAPIAWRSIAWVYLLSFVSPFLLLATAVLFPFLPVLANTMDRLGCYGAHLLGVQVRRRSARGWFDGPRCVALFAYLGLSLLALLVSSILLSVILSSLTLPFVVAVFGYDPHEYQAWFWNPPSEFALFSAALALTLLSSVMLIYFSWLIAWASVYVTMSTNNNQQAQLEQSREILIDAFTGERRRIERELHDGVQQYLTALQLNIATIELKAGKSEDFSEQMAQARVNSQKAMEALRSTVRGIYPQVLQDKGLVEALKELVAHSGLEGTVVHRSTTTEPLDATRALLLYHCAAEGITNAVKHGAATRIQVRLDIDSDAAHLSVDNAGAAFNNHLTSFTNNARQGTGLAGLKERARALGGSVVLTQSNTLGGACLRMSLPVPESVLP